MKTTRWYQILNDRVIGMILALTISKFLFGYYRCILVIQILDIKYTFGQFVKFGVAPTLWLWFLIF